MRTLGSSATAARPEPIPTPASIPASDGDVPSPLDHNPSDPVLPPQLLSLLDRIWPLHSRPIHATAAHAHRSDHAMDLEFEDGDVIAILGREGDGWWNGVCERTGEYGSFHEMFVEPFEDHQGRGKVVEAAVEPPGRWNGNSEAAKNEGEHLPPRPTKVQTHANPPPRPKRSSMITPQLTPEPTPTSMPRPAFAKPAVLPRPISRVVSSEIDTPPATPPRPRTAHGPPSLPARLKPAEDDLPPPLPSRRRPEEAYNTPDEEEPPPLPSRPPVVALPARPTAAVLPPRPGRPSATKQSESLPPRPNAAHLPPRPSANGHISSPLAPATVYHDDVDEAPLYLTHPSYSKVHSAVAVLPPGAEHEQHPPLEFTEADFVDVDAHAREAPYHVTGNFKTLARYLTEPFEDPLDQYRAIYAWIALNIEYDTTYAQRPPEEALIKRLGVCAAFAGICHALCSHAHPRRLFSRVVSGGCVGGDCAAGDHYLSLDSHAWILVVVRGQYRFLECTWGAGSVSNGTFTRLWTPRYFMMRPEDACLTHHPQDPADQMIERPLTHNDFIRVPRLRSFQYRLVRVRGGGVRDADGEGVLSALRWEDGVEWIEVEVEIPRSVAIEPLRSLANAFWDSVEKEIPTEGSQYKPKWLDGAPRRAGLQALSGEKAEITMCHTRVVGDKVVITAAVRRPDRTGRGYLMIASNAHVPLHVRTEAMAAHNILEFSLECDTPNPKGGPVVKTYLHDLSILSPRHGDLLVGDRVTFRAVGGPRGLVAAPGFMGVHAMRDVRDVDGCIVQEVDVLIDRPGEWHVCVKAGGNGYGFAGTYVATGEALPGAMLTGMMGSMGNGGSMRVGGSGNIGGDFKAAMKGFFG
ncbi:hypothetical protein HK101_007828, partial [Irineochytrium annulatum]